MSGLKKQLRSHWRIFSFSSLFLLAGCSSPDLYQWGDYDEWLYKDYKNPVNHDERLFTELSAFMEEYESRENPSTKPMAPGLYAEYGFLLMQRGEYTKAIEYYNKEKALWPESAVFMDSMIQTAQQAQNQNKKAGAE